MIHCLLASINCIRRSLHYFNHWTLKLHHTVILGRIRTDPVHLDPEGDLAGDQLLSQVVILLLQADQCVSELLVLTLHKEKTVL